MAAIGRLTGGRGGKGKAKKNSNTYIVWDIVESKLPTLRREVAAAGAEVTMTRSPAAGRGDLEKCEGVEG